MIRYQCTIKDKYQKEKIALRWAMLCKIIKMRLKTVQKKAKYFLEK